jgi:hypothetical protein
MKTTAMMSARIVLNSSVVHKWQCQMQAYSSGECKAKMLQSYRKIWSRKSEQTAQIFGCVFLKTLKRICAYCGLEIKTTIK